MSNGVNGLFLFVEQGTDPREAPGFDAPVNSLCTFGGAVLVKSGDAPTAWTAGGGGGGGFTGGTVPDPTTFLSTVAFDAPIESNSGDALTVNGSFMVSGGGSLLTVDADANAVTIGAALECQSDVEVNGGLSVSDNIATAGGDISTPNNVLAGQIMIGPLPGYSFRAIPDQIGFFGLLAAQQAAVPDAAGGTTVDAEARAAINALLLRLRTYGLIVT